MKDRFTNKIYFKMWVPAIVSSFGWALSDIADAVVVGQRMGNVGLAAISLILPVYMINCTLVHGLSLGGSVRYSAYLAQGQVKDAVNSFNHCIKTALLVSLAIAVLGNLFIEPVLFLLGAKSGDTGLYHATKDYLQILLGAFPLFFLSVLINYYLRNDNNQTLAGVGSVIGNLTDIACNILFVLLIGMGTRGAALSTLVGQVVAILIYLPGIFNKKYILKLNNVRISFSYAFNAFREGVAGASSYFFSLIFIMFGNNYLIRRLGEDSVAVFDMIQNTSYLILYLYEGTVRAMQPLLSTYHGERRKTGKRIAGRIGYSSGLAIGIVMALFIAVFARQTCALFGIYGEETIRTGVFALRLFCIGSIFAGLSILSAGYYQSCDKLKYSFLINALRGFAVLFIVTLLCSMISNGGFWWLFPVTEAISFVIWFVYIKMTGKNENEFDENRIFNMAVYGHGGIGEITDICDRAAEFCERWNATVKQSYFVTMTIEELCVVIMENGFKIPNKADDKITYDEKGYIEIVLAAEEEGSFTLRIRDNARFFDPFALKTDKISEDGSFDMDAMGVLIIKKEARDFFYRRYGGFNSLVVNI